MHDPYAGVDWSAASHLHSVSHTHTDWSEESQAIFDSMYDRGIRHFAISNYEPAKPTYPLESFFDSIPEDAIGCPNAEHRPGGHYCSIGSTYSHHRAEQPYEGSWERVFRDILDDLAYDDGGGIVLNHPRRHHDGPTAAVVEELDLLAKLDFDPRVLGIEAYNHRSETKPKYDATGDAIDVWDELLSTGRQVFGFFNPDFHGPWLPPPEWTDEVLGRNVLLVSERTERAAARAYRRGQFYGALRGSGLRFDAIRVTDGALAVRTNEVSRITVVSEGRTVAATCDDTLTHELDGEPYVRVEAADGEGERLFSQPIVNPSAGE